MKAIFGFEQVSMCVEKDREWFADYQEYADIKTDPPKEGVVSLVGRISSIHLPLGGRFLEPAEVLVSEGDEVEYGQKIGEPVEEGFSVGVWASAGARSPP